MGNFRLRMVLLGLVLGVLVAIVVASQGCGTNHHHAGTVTVDKAAGR